MTSKIGCMLKEAVHPNQMKDTQLDLHGRQNAQELVHRAKKISQNYKSRNTLAFPFMNPSTFTIVTIPESLIEVEFFG